MQDYRAFRFEQFQVHPAQRRLVVRGCDCAISARTFDLLVALVERRDRLVTQDELLEVVWSDVVVEDNNLAVQVRKLRKILGKESIATVPGRGYRLTARLIDENVSSDAAPANDLLAVDMPPLGRAQDAATVDGMLSNHRLVTLLGPCGAGKTRLALWLARAQARSHGTEVSRAELAGIPSDTSLASHVAAALGVSGRGAASSLAGLLAKLRSRGRLLLILENAECRLEETAVMIATLLQEAPELRILVSSEAPLQLEGEQVARLAGLSVPTSSVSPADAMRHGAVALFVASARERGASFRLDDANAGAVIDACRRLDGLPLAIVLAGACLPRVPLGEWPAMITGALDSLVGDEGTFAERHRSLRAAIAWSCQGLTCAERAALRRLAKLDGPFELMSALQQLAAPGDEPARWAALDALGALVERSFVLVSDDDPPLYRLQNLTRTFIAEPSGSADDVWPWCEASP
jgi:predicted ATPase/DNA-binding winged helix-turn-helix (wHTH) protein